MNESQTNGAAANVVQGMHDTADTARELAQTMQRGADAIDRASETVGTVTQKVERVTHKAADTRSRFDEQVRAHPLTAIAAAAALGIALGTSRH